jgi:transposase
MREMMHVKEFFEWFPNEESCLNYLMKARFGGMRVKCPTCQRRGTFVRLARRPAYICPRPKCGHHIYPAAETPFAYSRIALQKWFYALYLLTSSESRVSAKELQRQLGVTYKSAWRMKREITEFISPKAST